MSLAERSPAPECLNLAPKLTAWEFRCSTCEIALTWEADLRTQLITLHLRSTACLTASMNYTHRRVATLVIQSCLPQNRSNSRARTFPELVWLWPRPDQSRAA